MYIHCTYTCKHAAAVLRDPLDSVEDCVLRDPPDSEEGCVCRGHPVRIPGCL